MLHILGMGSSNPDQVIDNKFLEDLDVGTSAEWIESKIGIRSRVTTLPLEYIRETRNQDPRLAHAVATHSLTDLGVQAAHQACQRSGIQPHRVGMVVCNTSTPRSFMPFESQRIAQRLGLSSRVKTYDVFTACPAFALHMDFLSKFRPSELPEYILGICTSTFTQIVNYNNRTDGAIWGDGAAAYIVSPTHQGPLAVRDTIFSADPKRCQAVVIDRAGHFHQDGRAVRDFSVRQTVRLLKRLEQEFDVNWERDVFIGHQANRTMLEQVANNRKIPEQNHWHNVTYLGNQAAAGAPSVLAQRWQDIQPAQKFAVAVLGAGLSWGSVLLEAC
jgi:3-oxoacyl-[acyl-carrier-protein] synthase III